ncbi:MAG: fructose-bisphosphate aldolase class I [Candidatus Omnitrophica bacterium]|nr:fructose-bisphosphate aldolase class I [Candidatus Omnitrophota bacterium]
MFQKSRQGNSVIRRFTSALTVVFFITTSILPPSVAAQSLPELLNMPAPGVMVKPTVGYTPALIKGIAVNPDDPLNFTFYVSPGDEQLNPAELRETSDKLIKYFLATLTTPSEDLWVNLSPHEKDRIISDKFGMTEMGRDLLAQDYILKQMTASLMYPEDELGRDFWQKVHSMAAEKYGTAEIPTNTFNKVWIVPESAAVYENASGAFVVSSRLKVLLAQDYLAMQKAAGREEFARAQLGDIDVTEQSGAVSDMIREILVPEIEREVNTGKTFANLRQVYNSMILASWFKNNLKQTLLGQVYVDRDKTAGVDVDDPAVKEKIYQQYLKAFKLGVYNYIKEEYDPVSHKTVPRQYFSGGTGFQRLAALVGDTTYTTDSIRFAPPQTLAGAQALAEETSLVAVDVDLWEADGEGVNEGIIGDAVQARVAEIISLDRERQRRLEVGSEAVEVLSDAATLAELIVKVDKVETFKWGGSFEDAGTTIENRLTLDPKARTVTLERHDEEPIVIQLESDFVGVATQEGVPLLIPEAEDNGRWLRTREDVPGHPRFERVHTIVVDDKDYDRIEAVLRQRGVFPNMSMVSRSGDAEGKITITDLTTKVRWLSHDDVDEAQLSDEVEAVQVTTAEVNDTVTFNWGGYKGGDIGQVSHRLMLDPVEKTITVERFLKEPIVIRLTDGFVGIQTLQGAALEEESDVFGSGQWIRRHEYVDGSERYEIVHKVLLSARDLASAREQGLREAIDITGIDSNSSGSFRYNTPTTAIAFVDATSVDGAQLGEVDMAKFEVNSRWSGDLAEYTGEEKVINARTNELIAQLTQKWAGTIAGLLRQRERVQDQVDRGELKHGFMPADAVVEDAYGNALTAREIREGDWKVDEVPEPLTRPGAILTGPWSDPKWAINSLTGGAVRVFNDYEDAGWDKGVAAIKAKQTQMDILSGAITEYEGPKRTYFVPDRSEWPVLTTRVRGLHYNSKFFGYDGITAPAIVEDLVHLIVNNYQQLQEQGSGVNVVIPKLQTPEELKTVAQIIADIEQALGLPVGTVRIILMNERIELTLQLEEAIWAARKHVAVTNVGRWDKMASDILARRERGDEIEPNPTAVGMDQPHLAAYVQRNVDVSLKRGAEPEGGMVVQMMSRGGSHPETDAWVVEKIRQDKIGERNAKMKFAWVATPQVVGVVNEVFQSGDYSDRQADPYGYSAAEEAKLVELPTGALNKEGVRKAVYDSLAYAIGFRTAGGAVAIVDETQPGLRLMQDLAVLKINYYWLWKLVHHRAVLDDLSEGVTPEYVTRVIDEQVEYIKSMSRETPPRADTFPDEDWDAVATTLKALVTADKMVTWESVVMNNIIDEDDPEMIQARLRGIFTPREELVAELNTAIAQKQERRTIRAALAAHDEVHYSPPTVALTHSQQAVLSETAKRMVPPTGGILAADESIGSAKKRLDMVGLDNTYEYRQLMRRLMLTAPGLKESGIDSVILFAETFDNEDEAGNNLVQTYLVDRDIAPGIKTDKGLEDDPESPGEQVPNPKGLAELPGMLAEFRDKGAVFTKWRTVQHINPDTGLPTDANILKNAVVQARAAKLTQEAGLVPIVEPEVMYEKSAHSLADSYGATVRTLQLTFDELVRQGVFLGGMILKSSMILAGQRADEQTDADTVGMETLKALLKSVPAAVPAIVFLSGGQNDDQVIANLDAVIRASQNQFVAARDAVVAELEAEGNQARADEVRSWTQTPWEISYSFGRGLQRPALLTWGGAAEGFEPGQRVMAETALTVKTARQGKLGTDEALLAQVTSADFRHPDFTPADKELIFDALVTRGLVDVDGQLLVPTLMDQREEDRVVARYLGLPDSVTPYAKYVLAVLTKTQLVAIPFLQRTRPLAQLVRDTEPEALLVEAAKIRAELAVEVASGLKWDQSMSQRDEDYYRTEEKRKSPTEWQADLSVIDTELARRADMALNAEETINRLINDIDWLRVKLGKLIEAGVYFDPEWGSQGSLREDLSVKERLLELARADYAVFGDDARRGMGPEHIAGILPSVMAGMENTQLRRRKITLRDTIKVALDEAVEALAVLDEAQRKALQAKVFDWLKLMVGISDIERPALVGEINAAVGSDVAGPALMNLARVIDDDTNRMKDENRGWVITLMAGRVYNGYPYNVSKDGAMLARDELRERSKGIQEWMDSDRFRLVRDRNWSGEEIAKSRSQSEPLPQVDNRMPRALIQLMRRNQAEGTYTATGGVMDGPSAGALAEAGMPALYFSGWQGSHHGAEPDLAKYDYNEVPRVMERINKYLRNKDADKWQRFDAIRDELELVFDDLFTALRTDGEVDVAAYTKWFVDTVLKEEPTTEIFINQFREDPQTLLGDIFGAAVREAVAQKDATSAETRNAIRDSAYAALADYLIEYLIPFYADGDTGHQSVKEMVRSFVRAGAGGIHIEDQAHGCKKCGHMAGKVLVSTAEQHRRLLEARKEADLLGSELLIIARTDAEAAKLLQSLEDPSDHYMVKGVTRRNMPSLASLIRLVRRELRIVSGTPEEAVESIRKDFPTLAEGVERIWSLRGEVAGRSLIGENWEVAGTGQDVGSSQDIWDSREAIEYGEGVLTPDTVVRSLDGDLEMTVQELLDRKPARLKEEMAAVSSLTSEWGRLAEMKTFTQLVEDTLTKENKTHLIQVWRDWVNPLEHTRSIPQMQEKADELVGHEVFFDEEGARTFEGHFQIEAKAKDTVTGVQYGVLNAAKRSIKMAGIADVIWMEQGTPNVKQAETFVNLVRSDPRGEDILFAINLSPSFNWSNPSAWADQLTQAEIDHVNDAMARTEFNWGDPNTWGANADQLKAVEKMFAAQSAFSDEIGKLGFVFQFVTIFQDHVSTHAMWNKAKKLHELGAGGFVHYVQQKEQRDKSRFVKHQTAAGTKRVGREDDPWTRGFSTTGATGKESTENQFGRQKKDNALVAIEKPETTGGIDLNPEIMNLQIMRDGNGVALPLPQQPVETLQNIEGFIPVIMQMTPITNMPLILGLGIDFNPTEFGYDAKNSDDEPRARRENAEADRLSYLK